MDLWNKTEQALLEEAIPSNDTLFEEKILETCKKLLNDAEKMHLAGSDAYKQENCTTEHDFTFPIDVNRNSIVSSGDDCPATMVTHDIHVDTKNITNVNMECEGNSNAQEMEAILKEAEKCVDSHLNEIKIENGMELDTDETIVPKSKNKNQLYTVEKIGHLNQYCGKTKIYNLYTCNVCKKTFNYQLCAENHARIHTGERPFKCDVCHKDFMTKIACTNHKKRHTGERPHVCSICGMSYFEKSKLVQHMQRHAGEKKYKCDTCGRGFVRKDHLNRHIATHSDEKPFKCGVCGKQFGFERYLKEHEAVHNGQSFHCHICKKEFKQKRHIAAHMARLHGLADQNSKLPTPPVLVPCTICGKQYSKEYINNHMKTHEDIPKTNKCPTCGKSFLTANYLKIHQKIHTGEGDEVCDICGKVYVYSSSLRTHMLTHTGDRPYKCDVCGKDFTNSGTLHTHSKTHNKERNFQCQICGCRFVLEYYLQRHLKTHAEVGEYECKVCNKKFKRSDHLYNHNKRRHEGVPKKMGRKRSKKSSYT